MKTPFPNPNRPEFEHTPQEERKSVAVDTLSQQIMADLMEGVVVVDRSVQCIVWNAFMERLSGISAESLLDRNALHASAVLISFFKEVGVYVGVERALEGDSVICPDTLYTAPAGEAVWLAGRCSPLHDTEHGIIAVIVTLRDVTNRKRSEEALRRRGAELEEAQRLAQVASWNWDVKSDTITWSDELFRISGREPKLPAPSYKEHPQLFTPESWSRLSTSVENAVRTGSPYEVDLEMVRADGSTRLIAARGEAVRDASGLVVQLRGTVHDITERKRAEEALRASREQLQAIWNNSPAIMFIKDQLGRYLDVNAVFLRLTSLPREQILGKTDEEIFPPKQAAAFRANDLRVLKENRPIECEETTEQKDGIHTSIVQKFPLLDAQGQPTAICGLVTDITERIRAEEGLRESEERLRLAAQVGKMYAYDWDVATDVVIRSEEATRILGLTGESIGFTKQQLMAIVHPEDRAQLISSNAAITPESPNVQPSSRFLRPDGSVLWVERTGHAFFDEQGRMVRMIGMVADITERKLAEEALSKLGGRLIGAHEEERTRIARELHDDIGQRLALLATNLALMEKDLPDSSVEVRNRTHEHLKVLQEIAVDVQAMSHRLHSSKLRYLGIVAAAKSFCAELAEQHKVEIDFTHAEIPPTVPEEISLCLFRVMQEALQNAVKHSGMRHFEVDLRGASDRIDLTVRDSGLGFDTEGLMNNRGLGLVSMQERVNLSSGTFSIDSRPRRGTTIHVRLPLITKGESARAAGE